ncbi:MAG: polysaccharide biosynthesis protein [Anaerovoracaceae bacterium]|nr:polysaccharide biosynthesis protein [Anaerovoracaceae bacterium]
MSNKSFVKGAAILGAAGLIVKLLGAAFQIPLGNMIHDTGMAYYGPAYYIYTLFLIISTSALPVAISRMVSERAAVENYRGANRVFRSALELMILIGVVSFVIIVLLSRQFADLMGYPQSQLALLAISPALVIVPIMAAYRGYFQGLQNMKPTAVSQIMEQVFRVIIGLWLAYYLFHNAKTTGFFGLFDKYGQGAAGATFGATAGSVAGLAVVMLVYWGSRKAIRHRINRSKNYEHESTKTLMSKLLRIAIPITIGASIMPIMNILDAIIIKRRLVSAGFTSDAATSLYGQLSGFVMPLINFPQVLTAALAMSLVPFISSAWKRKDTGVLSRNTSFALRLSVMVGYPCAFGLAVLAEPIMMLLYSYGGEASAISAAQTLEVMAFSVIFLSIVQTMTGILQGLGKQDIPVVNMLVGIVIKVALTWVLTGTRTFNIKGAALATIAAYAVVTVLDVRAARRYTGAEFDWKLTAVKPMIATLAMTAAAFLSYRLLELVLGVRIACVLAVLIAAFVYVIFLFITGSITHAECEAVPGGRKILRIIKKFGL